MVDHPAIEDPSDYLNTDDFGVEVTIGVTTGIVGILDQEWIGEDEGVAAESIRFIAETAALPAITEKTTTLTYDSVVYTIMLHQKELGMSTLHLQEQ